MLTRTLVLATFIATSACGPKEESDASALSSLNDTGVGNDEGDAEIEQAAAASAKSASLAVLPSDRDLPNDAKLPIIAGSDPTAVTQCIYGKNVVLGLSSLGGGYVNFAHAQKDARNIKCADIRAGKIKNEVNGGYGRGWQSALRDRLHSGRFNPTQAGFVDTAGRQVPNWKKSTQKYQGVGSVARFESHNFQLPLFSDPKYDFTHFEDLHEDNYDEGTAIVRDNDHIAAQFNRGKDGNNQDAEVRSEFDYSGAMEVWTNAVGTGEVDVFRHTFTYVYQRQPKAILQFGKLGELDEGGSVIDDRSRLEPLSPKFKEMKTVDTDLSAAIMAYGIRFDESAGYDTVISLNAKGKMVSRKLTREGTKLHAPNGGDANEDDQYGPSVVGGRNLDVAHGSLVILCKCKGKAKDQAWGLYMPTSTDTNKNQIFARGGGTSYQEDRRLQTVFGASVEGEEGKRYDFEFGGSIESSLAKLEVKTFFKGLYAPGRTGTGVREGYRQEVFLLHGNPDEIVRAAAKLDQLVK